jgi:hypothetical protein
MDPIDSMRIDLKTAVSDYLYGYNGGICTVELFIFAL